MAPEIGSTSAIEQQQPAAPTFAHKLSSLPVVHSALDLAKTYYGATKTRYGVVERLEKELVGHIVPQVVEVTAKATPQSAQLALSKGLQHLDHFACSGLDALERKVPLIKEPTPIVLDSSKRFVDATIVHPVTGLVQGSLLTLDQLAERVLTLSEQGAEALLPELLALEEGAEGPEAGESTEEEEEEHQEGTGSPTPKRQRLNKVSRAQHLGLSVTRCISKRASSRLQTLRQPLSADFVRSITSTVERQVAWLKVSLEAALQQLHRNKEDSQLRKHFDTYAAELKASLAAAVERVERVAPSADSFKETLRSSLEGVSKSIAHFVAQIKQASPLNPAAATEPMLKKALVAVQASLGILYSYSQSLALLTRFGEPSKKEEER